MGFKTNLAELIIMTRQCVACKSHVARSKVKVKVHTYSLCIGILCSAHNFIRHGGICNYLTQMITRTRQCVLCKNHVPCVKGQIHSPHLQFVPSFSETCLCLANKFVVAPASGMMRCRDPVFCPFVRPIKALSNSRH